MTRMVTFHTMKMVVISPRGGVSIVDKFMIAMRSREFLLISGVHSFLKRFVLHGCTVS